MQETRWFEVDLATLRVTATALLGWPSSMSGTNSRMKEECLESVISLNLDALFPGELLLLVNTQHQIMNVADVLAIDPLGWLRVMELKRVPVQRGDLEDQVISYALHRQSQADWRHLLTGALAFLPERVQLSVEGFRVNQSVKYLGEKYMKARGFAGQWDDRDRFEKARLLSVALRAERGASVGTDPLNDPVVDSICRRVYGLAIADLSTRPRTIPCFSVGGESCSSTVGRWHGGLVGWP